MSGFFVSLFKKVRIYLRINIFFMRNILIIISFFLCIFHTTAQEADIPCNVKKSDVFKDEYKHSKILLVEEDSNGGVFIVRAYQGSLLSGATRGFYFEHYDANLQLIKEYEYELKLGVLIGIVVNNDIVHMIDYGYDKKKKQYVCSANSANIKDFKFTKKELFSLEWDEVKTPGLFNFGSIDNDYISNFIANNDKTAFAVTVDVEDKNNKEKHLIHIFDNDLNPTLKHEFKREVKDRKYKYENIDISEDGKVVYVLGRVKDKKEGKKGGSKKYHYELTRITPTDAKIQTFDTDEHYAQSLKTVYKNGKISCVGFYSDRNDNRFKGLCYFDMNPLTLDKKTTKFNEFTEQFLIDKYGKKKEKELKNISYRDIFLTPDNDIVFNAEEYYITTHQRTGQNGMSTGVYYVYHYDDIVTAKISHDGELLWARNINKRQQTSGDESYISYTSMIVNNDTYFFINTGEKVKKLRNDRIQFGQKSAKKSNLNIIKVNQNGEFEFKEILDDKDNEVPFMVAYGATTKKGNNIYFLGRKGRKKQLVKFSL